MEKEKLFKLLDELEEEHSQRGISNLNDRVLIVDFLNVFLRSFSASPQMNDDGDHCGGISGTLYSIGYAIRQINATRCIIVADGKNSASRRRKIHSEYKNKRHLKMNLNRVYDFNNEEEERESMHKQMIRLLEYFNNLPIQFISVENLEADDVISYISTELFNSESKIYIMSSDKDFLQLVNENIYIWSPTKKKMYDADSILSEFGVSNKNFLMYKKLIGDSSDNINGVDGIGLKKFHKELSFLQEDREVTNEELISHVKKQIEERKSEKKKPLLYQNNIINSIDILELNDKLMRLDNTLISGTSKMKIKELIDRPIKQMNKLELSLLSNRDKLYSAMPNFRQWIDSTFNLMNSFTFKQKKNKN